MMEKKLLEEAKDKIFITFRLDWDQKKFGDID